MLNSSSKWPVKGDSSTTWSRLEDKIFERALMVFPEGMTDRWEKIASQVPGKTLMEVKRHYEVLVHDVREIESGRVPLPNYPDDDDDDEEELDGTMRGWGTRDRALLRLKAKDGEECIGVREKHGDRSTSPHPIRRSRNR